MRCIGKLLRAAILCAAIACATAAPAEPITVSNYGVAASAMPYAVALRKGYFQEFGANVDAILDFDGSAALRLLATDKVAYAEVAPAAAAIAAQRGADIKIVSGNVYTVAGYAWIVLPSSPIDSINDLRGKRLGHSGEGSTTHTLNRLALAKASISPHDVVLSHVGGVAPLLTFLQVRGIDAVPIPEPLRSIVAHKYKTIAVAADLLPPTADAVGTTSATAKIERHAFIVGVLKARRKAIEFIHEHPADAATIIAAAYKAESAIIERVIRSIVESERATGQPYWDTGSAIRIEPIKAAISAAAVFSDDAASSGVDLSKLIDDSLLRELAKPSP